LKHISKAFRIARAKEITQFYLPPVAIMPLLRKHSPDGAIRDRDSRHLIAAYYSIIDPEMRIT